MDDIAAHLAQRYRVICPDTIGRGLSQWSPQPAQEYCLAFYAQLAAALVDQLGLEQVHWLGTSMGGAIGLKAAAGSLQGRIRRMVLNDVGPAAGRRRHPAHPQLCRQPAGLCHGERAGAVLPHRLQALRRDERCAVAAPDRNLDTAPARRPRHAALRPGDGHAVHPPRRRLRAVGRLGQPGPAGAVPARRTFRPAAARGGRRHAQPRPARGGGRRSPAAAMRRR